MSIFKIKSLRTKMMFWVLCASIVPNIIGGIYIGQVVMERSEAEYIQQARERINNIQYNLDYTFLNPVENMVSTLAEDERIININAESLKKYTQVGSGGFFSNEYPVENTLNNYFSVVKNNHTNIGTIFLGSTWGGYMEKPKFATEKSYDPRGKTWYKNTIECPGEIVTTDPYITSVTGKMVISVTRTIERDSEKIGVVGIMLYLTEFQRIVADLKNGQTGYFMVLNPNNKFVVSPKHPEWLLKSLAEINIDSLNKLEEKIDILMPYTIDNKDQVALINKPGKRGWKVIAVIDRAELMNDAMKIRNIIIAVYCTTLTLVLLIVTYAMTSITRPLKRMTGMTAQMADGNLEITNIEVGTNDELGQLAKSFSTMAKSLREARDNLEFKVEERTGDLNAANQELLAINEELTETLTRLSETQEELVKTSKMAALGNLVAGVAHEINTPAGVALTAASHLEKITVDIAELYENKKIRSRDFVEYINECQEATTIILFNLKRADRLINSFKQVAVDQTSEVRSLFNMKEYIQETLLSLSAKLKNYNHVISVNCDENLNFNSFPGGFSQILTNLFMNSIIHAYKKGDIGNITINVIKDTYHLIINFSDDGKGMEEEVLNRIFDPFFTTRRDIGGSGLGLHIVYNIITQQFNGTIECQSSPANGTVFVIILPLQNIDND